MSGPSPHGPARRVFLAAGLCVGAAAAGSALGLDRKLHHRVAVPPPAPPAELVALLRGHAQLRADCDTLIAADGAQISTLGPLRSDLAAHLAALRAVLNDYPGWRYEQASESTASPGAASPGPASSGAASSGPASTGTASPAPSRTPPSVASFTVALRAQASQLDTTCVNWPVATAADTGVSSAETAGTTSSADVVSVLGSMAACLNVHLALVS